MEHCEMRSFIQQAKDLYQDCDNYESHKRNMIKYNLTEKGKKALRLGWKLRRERMKQSKKGLSKEEELEILEFYKNTPKGFTVDHIIPLAKGGLHRISNLQYLTKSENCKKSCKI